MKFAKTLFCLFLTVLTVSTLGISSVTTMAQELDEDTPTEITLTGRRYVGKILYVSPRGEAYVDQHYYFSNETTMVDDTMVQWGVAPKTYEISRDGLELHYYMYPAKLRKMKFSADFLEMVSESGAVFKLVK